MLVPFRSQIVLTGTGHCLLEPESTHAVAQQRGSDGMCAPFVVGLGDFPLPRPRAVPPLAERLAAIEEKLAAMPSIRRIA